MSDDLQFETAESKDTRKRCAQCNCVITESFYQIDGNDVCPACAEARKAQQDVPDSRSKFAKAFLYGAAAALAGLTGWSLFTIVTGWEVGLVAIAVGWLVGTAIKKGAGGHTSRKYQVIAVALTYLITLLQKAAL